MNTGPPNLHRMRQDAGYSSSRPLDLGSGHGSPSGAPRPSLSGSGSSRGVNSREIELMQ
jgi:hypothetical protein